MTFDEALKLMGRDKAFRATTYAMNTLLIDKGVYTGEEFDKLFCEYAINSQRKFAGKKNSLRQAANQRSPRADN